MASRQFIADRKLITSLRFRRRCHDSIRDGDLGCQACSIGRASLLSHRCIPGGDCPLCRLKRHSRAHLLSLTPRIVVSPDIQTVSPFPLLETPPAPLVSSPPAPALHPSPSLETR